MGSDYFYGLALGIGCGALITSGSLKTTKPIIDSPIYASDLNEDGKRDYVFSEGDKKIVLLSQPDGSYKTLEDVRKVLVEEARQEALNDFNKNIESKLSGLDKE